MPVIIQQGKANVYAQPGVFVGISEESNQKIMNDQIKIAEENDRNLTLMLLKEDEELNDIMDELLTQDDIL